MQILLIDDSSTMRRIQKNILIQHLGYEEGNIFEAEDGMDAFRSLKNHQYKMDLVLCDWNMPNMDGITFVRKMQTVDALKKIPIIMVTTEAEKERIVEAIKAGARNYVVKPFTPDTLREKIMAVVG